MDTTEQTTESTSTTPTVSPPAQPTEAEAMAAAIAASQGMEKTDETPSETETPPETAETPAEGESTEETSPEFDVQQYWAHATRLDRENRALKEQIKALRNPDDVLGELKAEAAQNPAGFAEKFGLSLDNVLNALAGGGTDDSATDTAKPLDEKRIVEAVVAQLKPTLEEFKAEKQARVEAEQKAQETQLFNGVLGKVTELAEASPEKYELTRAFNRFPLAVEVAVGLFQQYNLGADVDPNKVLGIALDHVEKDLAEQEQRRIEALRGTKSFGTLFAQGETKPTETPKGNGATLGQAPNGETPTPRDLTEAEAMKAAIAAFNKASET